MGQTVCFAQQPMIGHSDEEIVRKLTATLQALHGRCARLKDSAMLLGTPRDSAQVRQDVEMYWKGEETKRLLLELRKLLAGQGSAVSSRQSKLRVEKLQAQGKRLLEDWTKLNRLVTQRMRQLELLDVSEAGGVGDAEGQAGSAEPDLDKILSAIEQSAVEVDRTLVSERNNDLAELKDDLLELKDVFVDTAQIIVEQGDEMEAGAARVDRTRGAMKTSVQQTAVARKQASSRRCKCCMCVCLLILLLLAGAAVLAIYILTDGSWDIVSWFKKNILHEKTGMPSVAPAPA